jgi:hypothetical protein
MPFEISNYDHRIFGGEYHSIMMEVRQDKEVKTLIGNGDTVLQAMYDMFAGEFPYKFTAHSSGITIESKTSFARIRKHEMHGQEGAQRFLDTILQVDPHATLSKGYQREEQKLYKIDQLGSQNKYTP